MARRVAFELDAFVEQNAAQARDRVESGARMRPLPSEWNDPPWRLPLDVEAAIARIPAGATMTGMFVSAVAELMRARGIPSEVARERYVGFQRYPLEEHCRLLVEAGRKVFPGTTLREALRRIGRGAPATLVQSHVGRVVLGSVEGPVPVLSAMAKSYMLHMQPCELEVVDLGPGRAVVRLSAIYNFLDCHNVGVFEGVLRHAGVGGRVRIHAASPTEADLLCEWDAG